MPLPSPSGSSVRSYYRPHQHSVDSISTTYTTSPPKIEHIKSSISRPTISSRYNTIDSCSQVIRDTSQYSRRQLSIEAVQCVFVDESNPSGTIYTFLVKPTLLQTGRSGARVKQRRADGARLSEQIVRGDDDHEEDDEQSSEVEPFQVQKSSKELLELSNRLVTSFDVLLDPHRGGPTPLSKDLLLPKWNVKDIFRRRKKSGSQHEVYLAEATSVAKKDVVNDFFLKVLRTGGGVLSSCRAMQDFFDRAQSTITVSQRDDRIAVPPRRPPRPDLSALHIDKGYEHDGTEQLTASPSWNTTPSSTPISTAMSEPKVRLWKKMQGEGPMSTPTPDGFGGMIQRSATYGDLSMPHAHSEIMMGDISHDARSMHSQNTTDVQLRTLIKSISQQDIRSELSSWRQEVKRASNQRTRKVSESSSLGITLDTTSSPARLLQFTQSSSPNTRTECHSAQVRQVSGIAVKAKASGWKIVKGSETPSKIQASRKPSAEKRELLYDSPSRMPSGNLIRRQSQSSLAPSVKSDMQPYVPSELEKLIFGTKREEMEERYGKTDRDQDDPSYEEYMGDEEARISSEQNCSSNCSSIQSEQVASYKVKGRAAVLRLNLSGRSNLHSESMNASAPVAKTYKLVDSSSNSIHSTQSERLKILTSNSQESWIDPDMSSSPRHSSSSAATTQSCQQYDAVSLARDTHHCNSSETAIDRSKNLRSLTLASRGHTSRVAI